MTTKHKSTHKNYHSIEDIHTKAKALYDEVAFLRERKYYMTQEYIDQKLSSIKALATELANGI